MGRFFADCASEFGLCELTGYQLNQPFSSVGVRRDCSSVNALAPYGGSLFSITSKSAGEWTLAHTILWSESAPSCK